MKKNILWKVVAILICFFIVDNVQAETCSTKELNNLKQLASNIKINYELYDDTYNENHTYYFNVFATNFGREFYLVDFDGQDFRYMENLEKDGVRNLRIVKEGTDYSLVVYTSNETSCPDTKIVTKKVIIPYYNDYSKREECQGIEEFSLCQKYYDGYIESEEYFKEQVNKYKNGDIEEPKEEKQSIVGQIITLLSNNLVIVIPIAIVLIIIIVVVIMRIIKSRKRTKIRI